MWDRQLLEPFIGDYWWRRLLALLSSSSAAARLLPFVRFFGVERREKESGPPLRGGHSDGPRFMWGDMLCGGLCQ